jgi:shikimate dehydrogenase
MFNPDANLTSLRGEDDGVLRLPRPRAFRTLPLSFDTRRDAVESLVARLRRYYPDLAVEIRNNDPAGYHLFVNATPLGMRPDDPLPFDLQRLDRHAFVGEVVLSTEMTPLLQAASARGCRYQIGTDMLFEQIPAYIEFFGYGATTPDELREAARIACYPENVG